MKLYEYAPSGNCYKLRLLFAQLGLPFERVAVDIARRETRTPAFLAKFPFGKVPGVELDDGRCLAESNAILTHFAEGSPLLPPPGHARAEAMMWLFWEQYSHEPYVAVLRAWKMFFGVPAGREAEVPERTTRAHAALATMNAHLVTRAWLAGDQYSIADIALYAYTHVAADADLDLGPYDALRTWLRRVRAQPRHVPIEA